MFKTSVDGILAQFHKTIAKLDEHAVTQYEHAQAVENQISVLNKTKAIHYDEVARAKDASSKLKAIFT